MPVPPDHSIDWSDSDEEDDGSDVETSVLLGIPDGAIEKQEDLDDAAVSRIGGHPAFLPSIEPLLSSSQCKNCSFPMELLVQLWCPFEGSTMDRALYIFGCARGDCQQKPGSVRAFRGLRYNATYAAKLEKKRARQREKKTVQAKAKEEEEKRKTAAKVNPFSMNANSAPSGGLFGASPAFGGGGLGSQLFGASPPQASESHSKDEHPDDAPPPPESDTEDSEDSNTESESESESESDASVLAAPARTPASSSPWRAAPAYLPPYYLSTALEYVPPAPKPKVSIPAEATLEDERDGKGAKSRKAEARRAEKEKEEGKAWDGAMEGYEDSMEVDKVFERFARIASYEGEQCIRYELGGTPLPFAHDSLFTTLFPSPTASASSVTSSSTKFNPATIVPARRTYNSQSSALSPCSRCGGPRTFECQLMPHLISVLQNPVDHKKPNTTPKIGANPGQDEGEDDVEARKKEVERLLRGGGGGKRGMEWGTCMVFSCARDCCLEDSSGKEAKEAWIEELVLVQWEE